MRIRENSTRRRGQPAVAHPPWKTRLFVEPLERRDLPSSINLSVAPPLTGRSVYDYGDNLTFTATADFGSSSPAGSQITFTGPVSGSSGSASLTGNLGHVAVNGRTQFQATLTRTNLQAGIDLVKATLTDDQGNPIDVTGAATGTPITGSTTLTVLPVVLVGSSLNPSVNGSPVTLTANVVGANANSATPTGTVAFMDSAVMDGTVDNLGNISLPSTEGLFLDQSVAGTDFSGVATIASLDATHITLSPAVTIGSATFTFYPGLRVLTGTLNESDRTHITAVSSVAGLFSGEYVSDTPDVTAGTTIASITSSPTAPTNGTLMDGSSIVTQLPTTFTGALYVGEQVHGNDIPAGTVVTAVSSGSVTLSTIVTLTVPMTTTTEPLTFTACSITLNRPIATSLSSGARQSLTFIGGQVLNVTSAGGTSVTLEGNVAGLYPGEHVTGDFVASGTTISSFNAGSSSTTITLSQSLMAGGMPSKLVLADAPAGWAAHLVDGHGLATYVTPSLGTGTHTIIATFNPTTDFPASSSDTDNDPHVYPQVVKPAGTTIALSAGTTNGTTATITATATVTLGAGSSATPTGTVTFQDTPAVAPQVWFAPDQRSDILDLFSHPDEWATARSQVNVLELGQPQLVSPQPSLNVVNKWSDLTGPDAGAGIVTDLTTNWKIDLASDTGVTKPQYLAYIPDSGVVDTAKTAQAAATAGEAAIKTVHDAGGSVKYVVMDSPYFNGVTAPGTPMTTQQIADTVSRYILDIDKFCADNDLASPLIGDDDPYPVTPNATSGMDVPTIEGYVNDLIARGTRPAFYHMDINYVYLTQDDPRLTAAAKQAQFGTDIRALRDFFAQKNISFGFGTIFFNGRAGDDRTHSEAILRDIDLVKDALGGPPPEVTFQNYASSGPRAIPFNVPETQPYTHTWLITQGLRELLSDPTNPLARK
jgi:hypothetical protein